MKAYTKATLEGIISKLQKQRPSLKAEIITPDERLYKPHQYAIFFNDLGLKELMEDAYPTYMRTLDNIGKEQVIDQFALVVVTPKIKGRFWPVESYEVFERYEFGREVFEFPSKNGILNTSMIFTNPRLQVMWIAQQFADKHLLDFEVYHFGNNERYAHSRVTKDYNTTSLQSIEDSVVRNILCYIQHGTETAPRANNIT